MNTLNLEKIAKILHMSTEGVRRKAQSGEIPASKPGRSWVFIEDDVLRYLRSQYSPQCQLDNTQKNIKVKTHHASKLKHQIKNKYEKFLGLNT